MSDMVGRENLTQLKESLWADVYNMGVSINGGTPILGNHHIAKKEEDPEDTIPSAHSPE